MSNLKLGQLITDKQQRDAIHVAVAPVVAGMTLMPGEHIQFSDDGTVVVGSDPIGIVDPYLTTPVNKGETFWLFLYPQTVTSLRHDWTHPAFSTSEPTSKSERWIANFANDCGLSYQVLMEGAADYVKRGDHLCLGGLLEGRYVPDEFWDHYEAVTKTVVKDKSNFFSCSC